MDSITRREWDQLHEDFRGVIDGTPHVVRLDPETGATVLTPVRITGPEPDSTRVTEPQREEATHVR